MTTLCIIAWFATQKFSNGPLGIFVLACEKFKCINKNKCIQI